MAQYAIAFDLNTKAMRAAGLTDSQITKVYKTEISSALAACGFTVHPQGSLYHTDVEQNSLTAIMTIQTTLRAKAPQFCKYVRRVHIFRMEEWSDVTELIADRKADIEIDASEEAEEAEFDCDDDEMEKCSSCDVAFPRSRLNAIGADPDQDHGYCNDCVKRASSEALAELFQSDPPRT